MPHVMPKMVHRAKRLMAGTLNTLRSEESTFSSVRSIVTLRNRAERQCSTSAAS